MDPKELAAQLRNPQGDVGRRVGEQMAEMNEAANYFTIDQLEIAPEDHVLEIGFGPGVGIMEACRLTPRGFVAGIDHSEAMLKLAQERCSRELIEERCELVHGDARSLPYEDGSFDKVFAVNVAQFWEDATFPLAEILRVLKPGGRVALFMLRAESWLPGLRESGLFVSRTPDDLADLLQDAGFLGVRTVSRTLPQGEGFVVIGER